MIASGERLDGLGRAVLTVAVLRVEHASRAHAQTPDGPRLTGVSTPMEPDGLGVSRRRFEASARSAWHHHDHGQLLYVEEGRARTQKRGRAIREMGPGESDYTAPEVEHWHGATPEEPFVQVAVGFGSGITWLDKVTDEEYEGRQSRSASVAAGLAQPGFLHERGDGDLGARCGSRGSPFPIGRCQWI